MVGRTEGGAALLTAGADGSEVDTSHALHHVAGPLRAEGAGHEGCHCRKPGKAKTINKYLGKDYEVLASFGHVRDLPAKDGSVRPDEDFRHELGGRHGQARKRIADIASAVKTPTS
jgi:hypothetical protein